MDVADIGQGDDSLLHEIPEVFGGCALAELGTDCAAEGGPGKGIGMHGLDIPLPAHCNGAHGGGGRRRAAVGQG